MHISMSMISRSSAVDGTFKKSVLLRLQHSRRSHGEHSASSDTIRRIHLTVFGCCSHTTYAGIIASHSSMQWIPARAGVQPERWSTSWSTRMYTIASWNISRQRFQVRLPILTLYLGSPPVFRRSHVHTIATYDFVRVWLA